MNYIIAVLIIVLASIAAGGLSLVVQRRTKLTHRKTHQEVGALVFLQLGVVFAVLLAFVVQENWDEYNTAGQAIDLECGALHGAAMIATSMPETEARTILSAEYSYIDSVIKDEWPVMARHRTEDIATDDELVSLIRTTASIGTADPTNRGSAEQILSLLAVAHAQREVRIFQLTNGIPAPLWVVLIAFTAVLILFVAFSGISWPAIAIAFTGVFAAGITSILVIARLLEYPFEGALAISASDYADVLDKIGLLLRGM
jgi:hypothetical protein